MARLICPTQSTGADLTILVHTHLSSACYSIVLWLSSRKDTHLFELELQLKLSVQIHSIQALPLGDPSMDI